MLMVEKKKALCAIGNKIISSKIIPSTFKIKEYLVDEKYRICVIIRVIEYIT